MSEQYGQFKDNRDYRYFVTNHFAGDFCVAFKGGVEVGHLSDKLSEDDAYIILNYLAARNDWTPIGNKRNQEATNE